MTDREKIIEILRKKFNPQLYAIDGEVIADLILIEYNKDIAKRDEIINYLIATFDIDINNDPELRQKIAQLKSELNK